MLFRLVRTAVVSLTLLSVGIPAFAQGWARPAKTQNTDVVCATCPGTYRNKLTIGYGAPMKTYTGRYLDSNNTRDYQQTFRTARATYTGVAPERKRLYMLIGSALFAYDTSTFFSRLEAGTAMTQSTSAPVNPRNARSGAPEEYLQMDRFFYAENGSGWVTPVIDGQDRLFGFDWDDRNLVYLAYSIFGWGIVRDDGANGGTIMDPVYQKVGEQGDLSPASIMSVKVGSSYYALVCEAGIGNLTQVYNTTNAAAPTRMPDHRRAFSTFAKSQDGSRVAVIDGDGRLAIYAADAFATGGGAIKTLNPTGNTRFTGVDTDGTNFYGVTASSGNPMVLWTLRASGSTYTESSFNSGIYYNYAPNVRYGAGYLTLAGYEGSPVASWNIRIFKLSDFVPKEVATNNYFKNYYYSSPTPYVHPEYINITDSVVVKQGTKYYLIVSAKGIGDVYEIQGADSIDVSLRRAGDVVNPNAKTPAGGGPFYGDRFTFGSSSSSGTSTPVNWNFGNPEATDNTAPGSTGSDISHQYSGLTTLPATRAVEATSSSDSQVTGSVNVTLGKPTPRLGLKGTTLLFTQPDASSAAAIVSSDEFIDSSDGAVEGHYTSYTLDGTTVTKTIPTGSASVGACGSHSLRFDAVYGPYTGSGATLSSTATPYTTTITPIAYGVQPFAARIDYAGSSTNIVFSSASRASSNATDLPGGSSTAVTYTWELLNSSNVQILAGPTGTAAISAIPTFSVPKTTFVTAGIKARLTIVAASTAVGASCSNFLTSQATTSSLNGPDVVVSKSGCANVGAACTLTATSQSSASQNDWVYNWSIVGNSAVPAGSNSTYSPAITAAGSYTARLQVSNAIGDKTVDTPLNVAQPTCGSNPTVNNLSIGFSSATSTCGNYTGSLCKAGETITFQSVPFGYVPDVCDTWAWNFGDGTSSDLKKPTHAYSSNGSYPVRLTIVGGLGQATLSGTVTIGTPYVPPPVVQPPPVASCSTMVPDTNIFIDFYNNARTCLLNGGTCTTNDSITFTIATYGYNTSCANHTYSWSVNGKSGNAAAISNTFTQPGTYNVQVNVSNGSQSVTLQKSITITGTSSGGSCPAIDPGRNVFINFSNPAQTCTVSGGACGVGENIAFNVAGFGYNFSCGTHTYAWRFGDSTTASGQSTAHGFTTPGTYNVEVDVNNGGGVVTLRQAVTVGGAPNPSQPIPVASFTYETFGSVLTYKFTPAVDVADIVTKWTWNFGDGTTTESTGKIPTAQYHSFAAAGTYTVTLTTKDATRTFAPVTKQIVISVAPRGGRAVRKW